MNRGCGVEVLGKGKEGDRDRWGYVRQVPLGRVVGWRVWGLWVSLRWDNLNQLDSGQGRNGLVGSLAQVGRG